MQFDGANITINIISTEIRRNMYARYEKKLCSWKFQIISMRLIIKAMTMFFSSTEYLTLNAFTSHK